MYREKNTLVLDEHKESLKTESSEQVSNQLSLFHCLNSYEILIKICALLSGKSRSKIVAGQIVQIKTTPI